MDFSLIGNSKTSVVFELFRWKIQPDELIGWRTSPLEAGPDAPAETADLLRPS
jgi:hypothetical protein